MLLEKSLKITFLPHFKACFELQHTDYVLKCTELLQCNRLDICVTQTKRLVSLYLFLCFNLFNLHL